MYVFWWTGRGYQVFLVIVLTLAIFGILVAAGVPDRPWVWSIALLAAAGVNWHVGTKANRKKLAALKPRSVKDRMLYRARHKFMSLPMETFSIVIVLGALVVLLV